MPLNANFSWFSLFVFFSLKGRFLSPVLEVPFELLVSDTEQRQSMQR